MLSGIRHHVFELVCLSCGEQSSEGHGLDDLPSHEINRAAECIPCSLAPEELKRDARTLQVLSAGLPAPWSENADLLLRKRYGTYSHNLGCMVSDRLAGYVEGYNLVAVAAADRRFGHNVIAAARTEAFQKWKLSRSELQGPRCDWYHLAFTARHR